MHNNADRTPWHYKGKPLSQRLIELTTIPYLLAACTVGGRAADPALTWYVDGARTARWSYSDLSRAVRQIASTLRHQYQVLKGDRVAVISSNSPEAYLTYLAIMSLGAVAVPLNPSDSERALKLILKQVEPVIMIMGGLASPQCNLWMVPVVSISTLLSNNAMIPDESDHASDVSPDDLAVILFSSGTTSAPKGICLSHYNLLVNAEGLRRAHNLETNRNHLCILPLFHANAFGFSMVCSVYSGCHVVLCGRFPGLELWEICRKEHVNIISAVPQLLRQLGMRAVARETVPDLCYVVSAAAPLPASVAATFEAHTGIPIRQGYGLSECTNFATTVYSNVGSALREQLMTQYASASIGSALFGTEVRVVRPDGEMTAALEEGEILVCGHNVMAGYWQAPEETTAVFRDGWLHTGDLGMFADLHGERYLFITGRSKEIIIRHGENITPGAVEAELSSLLALGGAFAVCGFHNEAAGEEIGLYVQMSGSDGVETSVRASLDRCASRYRPRAVIISAEPIPVTATGKIQRKLLATRFRQFEQRTLGNHPCIVVVG